MAVTTKKKGSILLISGIDISTPAEYIEDSAARDSVNFELSRNVLTKRVGTTQIGAAISTSDDIMAGRQFKRSSTTYNVRVGQSKVEYDASGTWTDLGTTLTGTTIDLIDTAVPLLSGKGILCVANGIDGIQKWTGTGNMALLGGTPPVAKFIQEYKTYLVAANVVGGTDVSQRVQWSDTADPENWSTGNSGSVDLVEDGEDITGIGLFGNYVTIHKPTSIYLGYLVSTSAIFRFDRKDTGAGTVANGSIVNIPGGGQLFLAQDGIRIFNGISTQLIPSKVNDEIRDSLNQDKAFRAYSVLKKDNDEIWIGLPIGSQTTGETVYKYNYITGVLLKDSRANATTMWLGTSSDSSTWDDLPVTWDSYTKRWNEGALIAGSDQINIGFTDGLTVKVDPTQFDDNSSAINAFWVTKDFQDSQERIGRWQRLELWAKGTSLTVEYSTDQGNNWTTFSGSPITLSSNYPTFDSPYVLYFDIIAQQVRFRFSDNSSTNSLGIKQFTLGYHPRELRQ